MQSAIARFPDHGITKVDAVVLTHGHADACFGMDDLRALSGALPKGQSIPVYLREMDFAVIKNVFAYLLPDAGHTRYVAALDFRVFDPTVPLVIDGLELIPLEVEHGAGYKSLGYAFGDVVYISDLNRVYDHTTELLKKRYKFGVLPPQTTPEQVAEHEQDHRIPMRTFIIDALFPEEPYPSHYSLKQAIDEARIWRPALTLTVGMAHQMNHHKDNERLKSYIDTDNLVIELAFDGQKLKVNL